MSLVDLLFPQAELEALGNKWHEPAPKRRKVDSTKASSLSHHTSTRAGVEARCQRHSISTPSPYQSQRPASLGASELQAVRRSNSDSPSIPLKLQAPSTNIKLATRTNSCFPSFIEPSILKNYLRHLHPRDSHRYNSDSTSGLESRSLESLPHPSSDHGIEEFAPSPGSLIADSSSSPVSTDSCSTPASEKSRSGPFGQIFSGMRVTENERDMMEDLLSPDTTVWQQELPSLKRKQGDTHVNMDQHDYFNLDEALLQRIFPTFEDKSIPEIGTGLIDQTDITDKYLSGSNSAAGEPIGKADAATTHMGIVVYDYDSVSVDDFFDLEEAST